MKDEEKKASFCSSFIIHPSSFILSFLPFLARRVCLMLPFSLSAIEGENSSSGLWQYHMIRPFRGAHPQIHPTAFIEQSAQVIGDVHIGEESSVWFNAVLRGDVGDIRIGNRRTAL